MTVYSVGQRLLRSCPMSSSRSNCKEVEGIREDANSLNVKAKNKKITVILYSECRYHVYILMQLDRKDYTEERIKNVSCFSRHLKRYLHVIAACEIRSKLKLRKIIQIGLFKECKILP